LLHFDAEGQASGGVTSIGVAKRADPSRLSARARRDMALKPEITRVFAENFEVYGVRKDWRQLQRDSFAVARFTVERLVRLCRV
jgi:putative transposase